MRSLLAVLALASLPVSAQTHPPSHHPKDKLQFTLILSRHGIRPPLTAPDALNLRSSDPWPTWPVPLGHLTPHGAEALTQLGLYLRADLNQTALFKPDTCPTPADIYLYADTDERNVSSSRVTFAAFTGPTCPPLPIYTWKPSPEPTKPGAPSMATASSSTWVGSHNVSSPNDPIVYAAAPGEPRMSLSRDPTFLPIAGHAFPPPPAEASINAMTQTLAAIYGPAVILQGGSIPHASGSRGSSPANHRSPANGLLPIEEFAKILSPAGSPQPAMQPILAEPISTTANSTGDPLVSNHGPAPAASALIENLVLEYADAKPLSEVGWGRLGATPQQVEASLNRLIPLHVQMFAFSHRTPFFARAENSNLLAHILDTLQQAAVNRDLVPTTKPASKAVPATNLSSRPERSAVERPASRAATNPTTPSPNTTPPDRTPTITAELSAGPAQIDIALHPSARINGAFGPAGTRLVYISAHDTNLAGIAGLLNLHWTTPEGLQDDIPPDAEIVFELWQKHHRDQTTDWPFTVRIRYRAQTLTQLRAASALSPQTPPFEQDLPTPGCKSAARGCDLGTFLHAARALLDPAYTQLDTPPTQQAPPK